MPRLAIIYGYISVRISPEDVQYYGDKTCGTVIRTVAEQVSTLDRSQGPAAADLPVRDVALIEPDRDKPRVAWVPEPHLLDGERELLILVTLATREARARKAGDEHKCIIGDSVADFYAPIFTRPQVGRVPPHRNTRGFECLLQLPDPMGILTNI